MRLLPQGQDWTSYLWLIYIPYYAMVPFLVPSSIGEKAVTVAATLAALALYFTGYWLKDRRVLWVVGGFVALGIALIPSNPAAAVMFVYGASFPGRVFEPAAAYRYLGVILAIVGLEAALLRLPPYAWIPALVFTAMIGSVVTQQVQRRRLSEQLLMAQEEVKRMATIAERERIGRDLHDLLGHTLSVIILKSELASKLAATDPTRATAEIRDVERISREALTQVRSAVQGYRSRGIEHELAEARRTLETAGIRIEEAIEPIKAKPLSPLQEGVFAMALREGITNVVRHAQATVCRLTLRHAGNWFEMEIADNGRGGAMEEGSGLSGMRQRVEAVGGVLERNGSCGSQPGTQLRIRVPV